MGGVPPGRGHLHGGGPDLRASTNTRKPDLNFFTTSLAVGTELHLLDEQRSPLSRNGLVEALGTQGRVHMSGEEHRAAVRERLFPRFGPDRYAALITALLALRKEKLSQNLDLDKLSVVLSEALPPLDERDLTTVAEGFERLDRRRGELVVLETELEEITGLARTQRDYARAVLAAVAAEVRAAETARDTSPARSAKPEPTLTPSGSTPSGWPSASARSRRAWTTSTSRSPRPRRATPTGKEPDRSASGPRWTGLVGTSSRPRTPPASVATNVISAAESSTGPPSSGTPRPATRLGPQASCGVPRPRPGRGRSWPRSPRAAQRSCRLRPARLLRPACLLRRAWWLRPATAPAPGVVAAPVIDRSGEIETLAQAWARSRRAQVGEMRQALDGHRQAVQQRGFAEGRMADDEAALDQRREELRTATADLEVRLDAYGADVEAWARSCHAVPTQRVMAVLSPPPRDPAEVGAALGALAGDLAAERAVTRRDIASARSTVEDQLAQLIAERDALAQRRLVSPAPPPWRGERGERAGAPLWRLVDLAPGVDPDVVGGLEAALVAAGFLDAWVLPTGEIDLNDPIRRPLPQPAPRPRAEPRRAAPPARRDRRRPLRHRRHPLVDRRR